MAIHNILSDVIDFRVVLPLIAIAVVLRRLLAYPLTRWRTLRRNKAHGCQAAPRWQSKDPFLSLDRVRQMQNSLKTHSLLSTAPSMFTEVGSWTMEVNLAGKRVLWIADPEGVKAVLQTGQKDWRTADSRRDMFVPVFGQNIITLDGELWHETRSVMRPAFAKKYFENLSMLDLHVKRFLASLPTGGEETFDLRPQFAKLTMDFSTNFLFGFSTNSLAENADAHGDAFGKAFDELQGALLSGQALGKLGNLFGNQVAASAALVKGIIQNFIHDTKEQLSVSSEKREKTASKEKYNVLAEMATSWPNQDSKVTSEATLLLIGGRDTTAATLSNLFFYLARQPETYKRLREECMSVPAEISHDQLRDLRYLNDCIRESLRMVNPIVDLHRTCNADTTLPVGGGPEGKAPLFVEKNTHVVLWIHTIHHRKDLWGPDADDFRPERWRADKFAPWSFIPFGGGPKICLGQQLALTTAAYTTFRMARHFEAISTTDTRPWNESLTFGTFNHWGVNVSLIPNKIPA